MAAITASDTFEGTINGTLWFHYDLGNDVLYYRFEFMRGLRVIGDETEEGFTAFYTEDDVFAGMVILCFWKHFGAGQLSEASEDEMRIKIEQFARKHILNRQA